MTAARISGLLTLLWLFAAITFVPQAQAQSSASPHIKVELVAETNVPASGGKVTLAFIMKPDAGWHGYWVNPGDAGVGMDVRWTLPGGFVVGELRYPVPQKLLIAGLMNHVFEGPYALLADLSLPAGLKAGQKIPVKAEADWLACTDTICVPERGTFSLMLSVGDGAIVSTDRARFDRWRSALPRPLGGTGTFERKGNLLRLSLPFPAEAAIENPWFFRLTPGARSYATQQAFSRNGDQLIVEIDDAGGSLSDTFSGVLKIAPDKGLSVLAVPGAVGASGDPIASGAAYRDRSWRTVALALMGAVAGGLLLNFMPCVFPILSLKAISLAKAGGESSQVRRDTWAYTVGLVITCLVLGGVMLGLRAAGEQVGWAFQLQNPAIILLLCAVSFAIALNLAGVFQLSSLAMGEGMTRGDGLAGSFWTGALVAFVATPCTGPFMATALGAALILPWTAAMAIFAGLGIGLALPFLTLAYWPALQQRLPHPGPWMRRLQLWMALPMVLTAVALLWLIWRQVGVNGLFSAVTVLAVELTVLIWVGRTQARQGALERPAMLAATLSLALTYAGGVMALPPAAAQKVTSDAVTRYSLTALDKARASGKPVFLYFTADWCLSCKVNEAAAIERAEVIAAFEKAGVQVIVGDWTNGDPDISRFLEEHGRSGVPLYLWYEAKGGNARELPQILTPSLLIKLAEQG